MGQSKIWKDNWCEFITSVIHTTLCSQYLDANLSFLGFPSHAKGVGEDSLWLPGKLGRELPDDVVVHQ